jgi:uncharacterized protein YecA (UPF0149 family)
MGLFNGVLSALKGSGTKAPERKPGRNEDCWCGSRKKYKKCHLPSDEKQASEKAACAINCGPT